MTMQENKKSVAASAGTADGNINSIKTKDSIPSFIEVVNICADELLEIEWMSENNRALIDAVCVAIEKGESDPISYISAFGGIINIQYQIIKKADKLKKFLIDLKTKGC